MTRQSASWNRIAIVGRAGRFPGARGVAEFWAMLAAGRTATTRLSDEELLAAGVPRRKLADPHYVKAANLLPDMECFDAGFFGFSPREAAILDPQHRHFLECGFEALEDAGHMPKDFAGRIGVFAGVGMQAYLPFNLLTNPDLVEEVGLFLLRHTGNDKDFLPSRLSWLLDLTGPSVAIQTACSTGLVAVHMAIDSLLAMQCDMAIAGGVTIELPHGVGYRHVPGEIQSPDGLCRAFDDDSQGTVFGSGIGLVVLRRLDDALADGDDIKAVILGSAINNDGAGKAGYFAPSIDGQAAAAAEALAMADVPPATIGYLEAHGTGTPIGDPIELAAMSQVYGAGGRQFCGIGSVKTNIGHLDTAAGTASLIKVIEALRHGCIPPSLHYQKQNRRFDLPSSPFAVVDRLREWPRGATPRRAAVNSLGVGGTNAHVIVEEAPGRAAAPEPEQWRLFLFSARTAASLAGTRTKWRSFLRGEVPPLADVAFTLRAGRRTFGERLAIAARSRDDLEHAFDGKAPLLVHEGSAAAQPPEVVFVFPGGGAQYPGAGRDLLRDAPAFAAAVDACFAALPRAAPADLRTVMFERTLDDADARARLSRSAYAIPALFILEYAAAKLWESWGIRPDLLLAHSVGEYAAATIAGVFTLADALHVVTQRGLAMDAAPAGAMTTVPAGEAEVRALIGDELDIAVSNAPDVSVVSGTTAAIEALEARLEGTERAARRVHIAVGAHSRLLDGQLEAFRAAFDGVAFAAPTVPMLSSLRGDWPEAGDFVTADYWVRHLRHTVRFHAAACKALERPGRILLELGPGRSLAPLLAMAAAAHPPKAIVAAARRPKDAVNDTGVALAALGALWTHGVAVDFARLPGSAGRRVSLPTYAFEKQRHWIEPGHGRTETAAQAALHIERIADPADWFQTVAWKEAPLPPTTAAAAHGWLVFADDDARATAVVAELARRGASAAVVQPGAAFAATGNGTFRVRPAADEDYEALFAALGQVPERILFLWALGRGAGLEARFDAALCLGKALQRLDPARPPRLLFATAGAMPAGGTAVVDHDSATLLGISAVLPREMPGAQAGLVDVDAATGIGSAAATAGHILDEASAIGNLAPLVAWRSGVRFLPERQRRATSVPAGLPTRLRQAGTYVVTGGTTGIGRELSLWLARTCGASLALLSRSASGGDDAVAAVAAAGGRAMSLAVDVTDRAALAAALAAVRANYGAIHGVFHGAGTFDDAPMAAKTLPAAHAVMAPKIEGGRNLAALLPPGSLDLFAVFSSSSVVLAPPGQCDYVAANAWLEALAASRPDGLSIAFGMWRDVGLGARRLGTNAPATGPLLGARAEDPGGEIRFSRQLDPHDDWVLAEHVVGGAPMLPGAAFVELGLAAARAVAAGRPHELQALSLMQPLVCPDGLPREVTVRLQPAANGYEVSFASRAGRGAEAIEHARARIVLTPAPDAVLPPSLAPDAATAPTDLPGAAPQGGAIAFGPRWHNTQSLRLGPQTADGRFVLPAAFAGDLDQCVAHPALLDMAATVGLHLLDDRGRGRLYAPISVDRIRLFAPLPRDVRSRAVLVARTPGRFAAFDVVLRDAQDRVLAILERFALRAVDLDALLPTGNDARLLDVLLARGLRASEAPDLFARALDAPLRHVLISPVSLDVVRLAMAATPPAAAPARPATAARGPTAPPRNPVEAQLAAIWSELLGAADVGCDEDFFALGGHSLNAVRMMARVRRDLGVDLPLAALFEQPTIRALAARVLAQRPGLAAEPTAAPGAQAPAAAAPPAVLTCDTTAAQREIFAAILIDPGTSRAYHLSFSLHLHGDLDRAAAAAACAGLFARHDSLRAGFLPDGMTMQIRRDRPWQMGFADLAGDTAEARAARLAELHAAAVETPYDLASGPLFRATLIRLAADRHELLFSVHHIVCDGWSIGVLMREFHALYQASTGGAPAALAAPASIVQFVAAEQAFAQSPAAEQHRAYWRQRFAEPSPPMELPTDRPRPAVKTTASSWIEDPLQSDLELAIRAASKQLGVSLPNFVFAAFCLYLARVTGNREVVVGLPASGQLAYGHDGVVGHCVNFLPIRSAVLPEATFAGFVHSVRGNLVAALDHQNHAYGALVRELRLRRDPSRIALVPVIFNIDNLAGIQSLVFPGLQAAFRMNPRQHEHFELFVNLLDAPGGSALSWSYNRDLFEATTMAGHAARFRQLLRGLAAAPETRLSGIGGLVGGGARPASGSCDDPGALGPQSIVEVFRAVAARHAHSVAVRHGEQSIDYATLAARAAALGAHLAELGVRPGDLVGIASHRAIELVTAVLGTLMAGAGYVPFDAALPPERLRFMAADTGIKVLLGDCAPVALAGVPTIPFAAFPTDTADPPRARIGGDSVAYVMYTSGTTGRPKGVVLPHRSVIRMLVDNDWLRLSPATVTLHSSAFAFDTSIIDLFAALLHGGTVVLPPDGPLTLQQLATAIESHGVNTLWLTSGLFHAIADLRPAAFRTVDQLIVGGDVVSPVQVQKVMDACPGVTVINGYGPTESNVTNAHPITRADLASGQPLPIGRAIRGTQIWIVDEQGRPVEPGVQGELCIAGRGLALGYHNRPELTAEKFVRAAWDPSLVLYRSGDLAIDPGDGVLRFLGRIDGQVKIRGFRVEPGEVEAALESHPGIRQAVVVATVPPGQSDKVLAAYIVPDGNAPDRRSLDAWLQDRLPDFARPSLYKALAEIRLNANGKVDRAALPPIAADAAPEAVSPPEGEVEALLAAIWQHLLGLDMVDARANFFELGGHSLLAARLFESIHKQLGVDLPISTLFQNPTIRALAGTVAAAADRPTATSAADDWDTSVVIHPGPRTGPADGLTLFVVGGVGGNVNNLYELGQIVGRRRPMVGFQTRGILGHSPRTSIEAMAEEHIRYLRRHQPRGPFALAGYSGGALTAFEMARQLHAQGETVAEVFILDTFAPGFASDFRPVLRLPLRQRLRAERELLREHGFGFFCERVWTRFHRQFLRGPLRTLTKWLRPSRHRLLMVEDTWRAAANEYQPQPYDGRLVLLQTEPRAMMSRLAFQKDPTVGWSAVVAGDRLQRIRVPGDHLGMIQGKNAEALVVILEDRLRLALQPAPAAPVRPANDPAPATTP